MENYLRQQGLWRVLLKNKPELGEEKTIVTVGTGAAAKEVQSTKVVGEDELEKWEDQNSQTLGAMRLQISDDIIHRYQNETTASTLWHILKEEYGKPGVITIYLNFKEALELTIPPNKNPTPIVDRLITLFAKLAEEEVEVEEHLQVMILLAKFPPYMKFLAQTICQSKKVTKLKLASVR